MAMSIQIFQHPPWTDLSEGSTDSLRLKFQWQMSHGSRFALPLITLHYFDTESAHYQDVDPKWNIFEKCFNHRKISVKLEIKNDTQQKNWEIFVIMKKF